jgi:nitroreductase
MDQVNLAELLAARYGADAPDLGGAGGVLAGLLAHRSVRRFDPVPLPDGTLEQLVAAGQSAATSSNLQAWSVVAIESDEGRKQASLLCGDQEFIRRAPLFLVFCADVHRLARLAGAFGLSTQGLDFVETFLMAVVDASLAAQNVAIAAEAMGLGICYVGGARNHPVELARLLHFPPGVFAVFGMAVGRPSSDAGASIRPRLPQSAVLHRENYADEPWPEAVERYNQTMKGFYEAQKMNVTETWARRSAERVTAPESLGPRRDLSAALKELGFGLN